MEQRKTLKLFLTKKKGSFEIVAKKTVVENNNVKNKQLEIELDEAKKIDENYQVGDVVDIIITPENFGRIAAQTAKQVTIQKFLDVERENNYNSRINFDIPRRSNHYKMKNNKIIHI